MTTRQRITKTHRLVARLCKNDDNDHHRRQFSIESQLALTRKELVIRDGVSWVNTGLPAVTRVGIIGYPKRKGKQLFYNIMES